MTITQELLTRDNSLQAFDEGKWNGTSSEFLAFNDAGIECEVGEFLYGFIRVLKPNYVLETGTHVGVGAGYLGTALKDNKKGHLDTYEFLPENHKQAIDRINRLGLSMYVTCNFGDVANVEPKHNYQFIFLDTEPQTRFAEFIKFLPFLDEGGFIFIHDLHRHLHQIPNEEHGFAWPFGKLPHALISEVLGGKVKPFHLPTPRGLVGFYKVSKNDYKFEK